MFLQNISIIYSWEQIWNKDATFGADCDRVPPSRGKKNSKNDV